MKPPTGLLRVALLFVVGAMVAGAFVQPRWGRGLGKPRPETIKKLQDETIKKIQDCTDFWRSECADLNFRWLNGIEKQHLIAMLRASALKPSEVVCEEDATAEHCTSVRWGDQ